ncbi:trehalose-6-phosphate hydrolase [Halalkalicoccus paucihalophilus]|uniref:Trehalose-6-phosphate hydrolase n=1 Tax=Halalkalicoccus paucihalophilus TaxID=1008153 RepID=A0A151ACN6_9EURY|nr:DUF3459 domain-containing protein [Halalkalicoccus paucihalophilus]KYH25461.1 trehalose-6-phosphate hydrolase [Halalkalicoccus paucihalophilus]
MTNTSFRDPSDVRDVWAHNFVDERGSFEDARPALEAASRDNARTPMQWTDGENAVFSEEEPYRGQREPHRDQRRARPGRLRLGTTVRELIELRDTHDVLVYGDYEDLLPDHEHLWAYTRALDGARALVILNVSGEHERFEAGGEYDGARLLLGNHPDAGEPESELRPYEAWVYSL